MKNAMHPKGKIETTFYATAMERLERRKENVDVIVELHDANIQALARAMENNEAAAAPDAIAAAFEKNEYEKLVKELISSISLHPGALVRAYPRLPLIHLRLKWSDELDALARDSRVKAIYENFVIKSRAQRTSIE